MSGLRFMFAAVVVALCMPAFAYAQAPRLVVSAGDLFDVAPQSGRDIVEESAWIAQDLGGFEVYRDYELATLVPANVAEQVTQCRANADCLVDALFGRSVDYVLVVSTVMDGPTLVVHYELVDVQVGIRVGDTYAFLAGPTDFAALVAPCQEALDRAPDVFASPAAPVAPLPPPLNAPPTSPPTTPAASASALDGPSSVRRAGRITAAVGGAILFGGIVAGFSADEVQQQIQAEPHPRDELERLQQRGESRQRLANAAFGVGGAAVATGVTLVLVDALRSTDRADRRTVTIYPTLSGARIDLRF